MAAVETTGRKGKLGLNATRSRVYQVVAANESDAEAAVVARVQADLGGLYLNGLPLTDVDVEETNVPGVWTGTALFSLRQTELETPRTQFDFSQETQRRKFALETVAYGDKPPQMNGAIAAQTQDGRVVVDGVDVFASAFTFSKTKIYPLTIVDNSFLAIVSSVHLHWNLRPFAGFPKGEVLFLGCSGSQRDNTTYECTFRFAQKTNEKIVIPGIKQQIIKGGWQELDILWETNVDSANAALSPKARAAYVHNIYQGADFRILNLE